MMFDFEKKFDRIYCLSLVNNIKKREYAILDFNRIGLIGNNFEWKITVKNLFYKYIWNNSAFNIESWWKNNDSALNCTMGHYEIMKEALVLGYEHILILEDDCRFHKDEMFVYSVFNNTPDNYDICMYDKFMPINHTSYLNAIKNRKINDMFFDFSDIKLWSTACYALSRKAMELIVSEQEKFFEPADHVINRVDNSGRIVKNDDLKRVAAIQNAAVQDFYEKNYKSIADKNRDSFLYMDIVDRRDYNVITV